MKKRVKYLFIFMLFLLTAFVQEKNTIEFTLHNPMGFQRTDEYITIELDRVKAKDENFNENSFIIVINEKEVPYQIETGSKGENLISFVTNFQPNETIKLLFEYGEKYNNGRNYKNRTYAEISVKTDYQFIDGKYSGGYFKSVNKVIVPSSHKDHDALFKYEGPGWESEKVGYRFYLDWRNTNDIFGKKVNDLVLKDVGITDLTSTDNDSYHTMQDWGMDIFKVGSSLGIGSTGTMIDNKVIKISSSDSVTCEISKNGPIKSEISTGYYGWNIGNKKIDLFSKLSITAGSRLTKHDILISGDIDNLVTGLAKYEGVNFLKSNDTEGWNYIALYGEQSLAKDNLGIAVIYEKENLIQHSEDQSSYIVKLKPTGQALTYYFCAAWEQELNGIKSEEEFLNYLNKLITEMNNPITFK